MEDTFKTKFSRFVLSYPGRLAMPIGVYAGLDITGASVRAAVTDSTAQADAVLALHERFHTPVMLTAMDLSAEAEAFGCEIRMSDDEIPTVIGRRVTNRAQIEALPQPQPGDVRMAVHLGAARQLAQKGGVPVLGGLIGPFSLAGRIFGVSEALEASLSDPDLLLTLLDRAATLLAGYAAEFRRAGASGVIMAEPAAGLLSPRGLARFSAPFVKRIIDAVQAEDFTVILHNCGARLVHLPKVLESGAEIYHFGAPMDLPAALQQVEGRVILAGNLDPTAVFHSGTPDEVRQSTHLLVQAARPYRNFILSSGCDLPPGTTVANLEAFYEVARTA
jgi:uroporphyrinogen decarboxylase